jgi:tRNA(Ile)-lysidine synthase
MSVDGRASLAREIRHLLEQAGLGPDEPLVVAVSGGMDSLVLLHLLHFGIDGTGTTPLHRRLHPAHFDHGMRPESAGEAESLADLMERWGLPLHHERAPEPPASETEARHLRYDFLRRFRASVDAGWIATGNHADDQRETVLFRILRGTGIRGLRGMRPLTPPDLLRPLLWRSRAELRAVGEAAGLEPVEDPSNRALSFARNRIRHEILPRLEEVHPGAGEGLLRLSRLAELHPDALRLLLEPHLDRVVESEAPGGFLSEPGGWITISRPALLAFPDPVRSFLIRALAERAGVTLSEAGTAAALEFITAGSSGGRHELPGGVTLLRDFDRFHVSRDPETRVDGAHEPEEGPLASLHLPDPRMPGAGTLRVGRREYRIRWGPDEGMGFAGEAGAVAPGRARLRRGPEGAPTPLTLRGRLPGDRARHGAGRKPLGKLMGELRIPSFRRDELPLLVDASGLVIWIPGHWRSPFGGSGGDEESWTIEVEHVDPER